MATIKRLIRDDSGATAIEYALIAGLISIVLVASMNSVGSKLSATWTAVANNITVTN